MASDTHVEEELDMIDRFIRRKAKSWLSHADTTPAAVVVAGELEDLADEIERGAHWEDE